LQEAPVNFSFTSFSVALLMFSLSLCLFYGIIASMDSGVNVSAQATDTPLKTRPATLIIKTSGEEHTKMLQMLMKSGDEEQVLDLVDTPEFVLVQFCDLILRKQDLRNPDARKMLRETVYALKAKIAKEPVDHIAYERNNLKENIAYIEDLLRQFNQE
jgi:hypothetical protein